MNKLQVYKSVAFRPFSATTMLWHHRRTLYYLWRQRRYKNFYNHIFTTYFIRGEDCGKGVLDTVWKLTGKAPFLWDLEMETTTACYLKCIHCEHTFFDKSYLNKHLKLKTLKKVIDSVPNLKWINLTGEGTSILNPEFMDMVKYIKSRGIYLDFSHDFVKLSEVQMKQLIKYGVDRIYWSFDGVTKETYEKIRVGANFDQVCKNIMDFVFLKQVYGSPLPEICFRFCFFKDNVEEVAYLPDFLASLVDYKVRLYGDEPSINIVSLLEFKETKGWECEVDPDIIEQTDEASEVLGFKNYWSHVTHIEEDKAPMDYCTFWSEPYIMITGHVVPCCAVLMSNNRPNLELMAFGNINNQSLKDIWNSDRYRKFRKMVVNPKASVPKVCSGCRAFNTQNRARRYGVANKEV